MRARAEVKTIGDSFLVEFSSALEAVRCAVAVQEHLHERNQGLLTERSIHGLSGRESARATT